MNSKPQRKVPYTSIQKINRLPIIKTRNTVINRNVELGVHHEKPYDFETLNEEKTGISHIYMIKRYKAKFDTLVFHIRIC